MEHRAEMGEFLRSRRARLTPQDVGLRAFGGRRRVPGLRREELAPLAGVSVDYYVRLEQGRRVNVSRTVLDALATALRLTDSEREHLHNLAKPGRQSVAPRRVRPPVQHLLDAMGGVPAFVLGRRMDVLAWNDLACALMGDFAARERDARNMPWIIFMDPRSKELYSDWETVAKEVVAYLRLDAGKYPDDPRLAALVGELSVHSEQFRRWWAGHNVQEKVHGSKAFRHPVVGELTLDYESMALPSDPDLIVVAYTAPPGSESAERLRRLETGTNGRHRGGEPLGLPAFAGHDRA
ncbi:helix-turn-helix transcriptional regulator [Allokutzneria sp. A3M-2-11 16]|uniref:helix-turn-helix transcriptional regulator n=1 Tax=Allokutzneria sp. A3M-2-11 16 TaxID=2962043 RepID=UPI0020B80C29|nr:helix-turn-helix transcriptional regulator [Allokutzneria sp. A3M-2-11 16]MCP3804470.1 helix-turn-helix transcriptional regulator [Allokutzneria sp. A3M-2-11 16]